MVPRDEPGQVSRAGDEQAGGDLTSGATDAPHDDRQVTVDLVALAQRGGNEAQMLARYVRMIEVQRGDYNGRLLTIRRGDLTAIACFFGCLPDQVPGRLEDFGLRVVP